VTRQLAERYGTGVLLRDVRLAGLALLVAFIGARLVRVHGPSGFVVAGSRFVTGGPRIESVDGYDGQFVYRLAIDPLTRRVTDHGITLDNPGYRQQRIATAALAHVIAWLPGVGIALALILVNALAVAVAMWMGTRLASDAGRHPGWGLVLAAPACLPISVGRDLPEPLAWAALLTGLFLVRQGRWPWAATAFTVAVLARETSLVVVVGFAVAGLIRRQRQALWLLVPLAVEAAWQGWLTHVWSVVPIRQGDSNTSVPFAGALSSLFAGPTSAGSTPALRWVFAIERVATLTLIVAAAWLILRRRTRISLGETLAWLLASVLALSVRRWCEDVQFLRATYEAWGLSVLVLVSSADRRVLGGAAAVTLGITLMYVIRV
jgi:hypothetical protein